MSGWPSYSAYRDSGIEWLSEIPKHWTTRRLKYIAPESGDKLPEKPETLPYIGLEHIESWTGKLSLNGQPESVESTVVAFRKGDVLFGKLRPYLAKVIHAPFDGVGTTELLALRPTEGIDGHYFFYQLLSEGFIDTINSLTYGARMPRANPEQVANQKLPTPPLPEQRAIADFLDRKTAEIDALVQKQARLIELLEDRRAALISHAVTKGLDPDVPMKDSGIPWLGEIPAHWDVIPVKRIAAIRYGLGQPPRESSDGVPLIRATNVKHGRIAEKDMMYVDPADVPSSREAELEAGEIIVVRSGAYTGDSAIIPVQYEGAIAGYDMVVTVEQGRSEFLAWQLLSPDVYQLQFGFHKLRAAQPHLNVEELGETLITWPRHEEQQTIAKHLERETSQIDHLVLEAHTTVSRLQEYRTALISAAVTGKIDVREQVRRTNGRCTSPTTTDVQEVTQ